MLPGGATAPPFGKSKHPTCIVSVIRACYRNYFACKQNTNIYYRGGQKLCQFVPGFGSGPEPGSALDVPGYGYFRVTGLGVRELNSISSKLLVRILRAAGETTLGVLLVHTHRPSK